MPLLIRPREAGKDCIRKRGRSDYGRRTSCASILVSAALAQAAGTPEAFVSSETHDPSKTTEHAHRSAEALVDLLHSAQTLKNLPRTGWRMRGIAAGESVADHCFRTALAAMLFADELTRRGAEIDVGRTLRMALLHDLAECTLGDIALPGVRHMGASAKEEAERAAFVELVSALDALGEEYVALWDEYATGRTIESVVVHAADRAEMLLQALEYEEVGVARLGDFWSNADRDDARSKLPLASEVVAEIRSRRHERSGER